jgi:hypothetical protein
MQYRIYLDATPNSREQGRSTVVKILKFFIINRAPAQY